MTPKSLLWTCLGWTYEVNYLVGYDIMSRMVLVVLGLLGFVYIRKSQACTRCSLQQIRYWWVVVTNGWFGWSVDCSVKKVWTELHSFPDVYFFELAETFMYMKVLCSVAWVRFSDGTSWCMFSSRISKVKRINNAETPNRLGQLSIESIIEIENRVDTCLHF